MKKFFAGLLMLTVAFTGHAQEYEINGDCVYLDDLLVGEYPSIAVQCGFKPGDRKVLPSSVVANTLKRSSLPLVDMPANFIITRSGYKLDEETLRQELASLYDRAHPGKKITLEYVRFGREIYFPPGGRYELNADLDKFGPGTGTLSTDGMKATFTYSAKVFEEGYITSDKIRAGEEFTDKAQKEWVDVTNLRGTLVKDISSVIAKRSLTKGRPVTDDMVEARPERVKGDTVRLLYVNGEIRVEISAVAESNAVVGKTFLVKNPASGKILTAVYKGKGVAEVY